VFGRDSDGPGPLQAALPPPQAALPPPQAAPAERPRVHGPGGVVQSEPTARRLDVLAHAGPPTPTQSLLKQLLSGSLMAVEDWQALPAATHAELKRLRDPEALLERLVALGLLTEYQAARVTAARLFGLVLGNYRVLARLGAGGMG